MTSQSRYLCYLGVGEVVVKGRGIGMKPWVNKCLHVCWDILTFNQQRSKMQLLYIYYFADLFANKMLLPNNNVELIT